MDIENKDDVATLVKLLRYMPKSHESAAADLIEKLISEREQLLAQEPMAVMGNNGRVKAKCDFDDVDSFLRLCRNNIALYAQAVPAQQAGNWYDAESVNALVRRLDVALNGEQGAERQAMLCEIVAQIESMTSPALAVSDNFITLLAAIKEHSNGDVISIPDDIKTEEQFFDWLKRSDPSPRITEQDAMAVIQDYLGFCAVKKLKSDHSGVTKLWLRENSKQLINKLNAKDAKNEQ